MTFVCYTYWYRNLNNTAFLIFSLKKKFNLFIYRDRLGGGGGGGRALDACTQTLKIDSKQAFDLVEKKILNAHFQTNLILCTLP